MEGGRSSRPSRCPARLPIPQIPWDDGDRNKVLPAFTKKRMLRKDKKMTQAIGESSRPYRYDVFLSFHGEDTRNGFTNYLHEELKQSGIAAFMDEEELWKGEEIAPAILRAIGESRISIVVFSENYASSSWCLDELVRIVECRDTMGQIVWPVFYKVDPSDVRKQRRRYGRALNDHEERLKSNGGDSEKVKRWRKALTKAANVSGWHLVKQRESNVIRSIVKAVCAQLKNRNQLHIPENVVAMDSHVDRMHTLLDMELNEVRIVGICGFGGIGKTTIAKATYNAFVHKFEYCRFLSSVRESCEKFAESGLLRLQEALIYKGESRSKVTKILGSCDLCPDVGIAVLIDKSLITIEYGKLEMHDMIQEMGREIVRRESPKVPGKRSRL
ncbi:disease resistance protein RUN1 isoform X3 [Eucalyptus grandis]|uniref:disease resistance protein RUN1 isoform X3 n=1 Tax=Eucalyptus grandis TaxID=71139 RepID=UPI00192E8F9C|nr:disease resistance protein RUN1 isoform X3 [Eucalyptus grandis]